MVPLSMPVRRRIRHMPQLLVPGRFGYKWLCFVVLIAYNEYFRLKLVKNHQQLYASNLEIDFGLVIDMPSFICTQKMFPFFCELSLFSVNVLYFTPAIIFFFLDFGVWDPCQASTIPNLLLSLVKYESIVLHPMLAYGENFQFLMFFDNS